MSTGTGEGLTTPKCNDTETSPEVFKTPHGYNTPTSSSSSTPGGTTQGFDETGTPKQKTPQENQTAGNTDGMVEDPNVKAKSATVEREGTIGTTNEDSSPDMPKQKKLHTILNEITQHGLSINTEIGDDDRVGVFLLAGPISAGKSSLTARLAGCDFSPSSQKVETRSPLDILLLHTPDLHEAKIDLVLPELKKSGNEVFHEKKEMKKILPSECKDALANFNKVILKAKGQDALVRAEVKITIRSNYVPTMRLLDIPGLEPSLTPNMASKNIFTDNLKKSSKETVNTIVCSTVNCTGSSVNPYLAYVKKACGDALGDSLIVYTHIDKSGDPDYKNFYDPDEPQAVKRTPYYRLLSIFKDQDEAVGLYNKNTNDKRQINVTILEQTEKEDDWINTRVKNGEITEDTAKKLGLKALRAKLDGPSMKHLGKFMKRGNTEAKGLKGKLEEELKMLGIDPSDIDPQDLQNDLTEKIAKKYEHATKLIEQTVSDIYSTITDGRDLNLWLLDDAKERFAGGNFALEIQDKMKSIIEEVFDEDSEGPGMRISRFPNLRSGIINTTEGLAEKYGKCFREEVVHYFRIFKINHVSSVSGFGLDNVIKGTIHCHTSEVVEPLFDALRKKVCEIWSEKYLEEDQEHASNRKKLNEKLQVLEKIIQGWKELLPEESILSPPLASQDEDARKTPPPPPANSEKSPRRERSKEGGLRNNPPPKRKFPLEEGEEENPKKTRGRGSAVENLEHSDNSV